MRCCCGAGRRRLRGLQQENEAFVRAAIITQLSDRRSARAPELNKVAAQPAAALFGFVSFSAGTVA